MKRARLEAGRAGTLDQERHLHFVAPGDIITADTGFMRGHGTYAVDGKLIASVAGVVERVNKLICVKPLKSRLPTQISSHSSGEKSPWLRHKIWAGGLGTRYNGEVGDVVVGRIIEVQQKRWKVDTFSRLESVLLLSSVNLPGGVLRRRGAQDQLMMRDYFEEGDLISAEVQQVFFDGSLSLHTRSLKYGKLTQGTLLTVPPSLVKRCKNHFHNLLCGASVILGNNGYIWITPLVSDDHQQPQFRFQTPTGGGSSVEREDKLVTKEERETIARLRNCIVALVQQRIMLFDTSIQYTYDASLKYKVKELLKPEVMEEISEPARNIPLD